VEVPVSAANLSEGAEAIHVDQLLRPGEAEVEQRHEALAPRQYLRIGPLGAEQL